MCKIALKSPPIAPPRPKAPPPSRTVDICKCTNAHPIAPASPKPRKSSTGIYKSCSMGLGSEGKIRKRTHHIKDSPTRKPSPNPSVAFVPSFRVAAPTAPTSKKEKRNPGITRSLTKDSFPAKKSRRGIICRAARKTITPTIHARLNPTAPRICGLELVWGRRVVSLDSAIFLSPVEQEGGCRTLPDARTKTDHQWRGNRFDRSR